MKSIRGSLQIRGVIRLLRPLFALQRLGRIIGLPESTGYQDSLKLKTAPNDSGEPVRGQRSHQNFPQAVQLPQHHHIVFRSVHVYSYFLRKVSQNAPAHARRFAGMSCFPMIPESRDRADGKGPAAMKKSPKAGCHKDARELALPT
jgi:hypothetical protein